jgi:hypothetical protein
VQLVGDQLGGDVFEVDGDVLGRGAPAPGRGSNCLDVRGGAPQLLVNRREARQRFVEGRVALGPAPGRGQGHYRLGPPARGELQRHIAAQRVAGDVRGLEARVVHRPLDRVREQGVADVAIEPRPARVAEQRRSQHVVPALERRQRQLPGPPGVREPVQAHERGPGTTAM